MNRSLPLSAIQIRSRTSEPRRDACIDRTPMTGAEIAIALIASTVAFNLLFVVCAVLLG